MSETVAGVNDWPGGKQAGGSWFRAAACADVQPTMFWKPIVPTDSPPPYVQLSLLHPLQWIRCAVIFGNVPKGVIDMAILWQRKKGKFAPKRRAKK